MGPVVTARGLWRQVVESFARLNFFTHAVGAVIAVLMLPVLLYFSVAPSKAPMANRVAVRGAIESARTAPCLDRLRKTVFSPRGCVDGNVVTYRDANGLMQSAVFHLPGYAPFDSTLYPRGGVFDVVIHEESLRSARNQHAYAVAVNGAVLKPLKKEGLADRLAIIAFALLMALILATFIGRLQLKLESRAKAKALQKSGPDVSIEAAG